jgi:HAMP domain-containing protein
LCEDSGLIVGSTPPDLAGRTLADAARWAAPVIASARLDPPARLRVFTRSRDALGRLSRRGRLTAAPHSGYAPTSDLAAQQAPALTSLHWRTATLALLALVICTGVWYYFSRTVTRRAMALVRITEAFAAGRLGPPLPTRGSDELAKLNAAFNTMARDLRARDTAIRLSEERFAHAIEASELGIWDWNLATDECTDNETWWRMFGYSPAANSPRSVRRGATSATPKTGPSSPPPSKPTSPTAPRTTNANTACGTNPGTGSGSWTRAD